MWEQIDLDATIREFDFTKHAVRDIQETLSADDFEDMPAAAIFDTLLHKMEIVSFGMHLKRYLYLNAQLPEPFHDVKDETYAQIIMQSFEETFTPHSFGSTQKRWSLTVRDWLHAQSVRRQTVFLLGFGLRMSDRDVSDFLMKVIKEDDFDLFDPEEVIYRYCLQHTLPFSVAKQLLAWYDDLEETKCTQADQNPAGALSGFHSSTESAQEYISQDDVPVNLDKENSLKEWLTILKSQEQKHNRADGIYARFLELYDQARQTAYIIRQQRERRNLSGQAASSDWHSVTPADLEKLLCCGIPVARYGNLEKASCSLLSSHYSGKRMTRQRLDKLLSRKVCPDRFDLITLAFFVMSQEKPEAKPKERFLRFVEETGRMLKDCRMWPLYPPNPYEASIMMCMLTDDPLTAYSDIWELSYEGKL